MKGMARLRGPAQGLDFVTLLEIAAPDLQMPVSADIERLRAHPSASRQIPPRQPVRSLHANPSADPPAPRQHPELHPGNEQFGTRMAPLVLADPGDETKTASHLLERPVLSWLISEQGGEARELMETLHALRADMSALRRECRLQQMPAGQGVPHDQRGAGQGLPPAFGVPRPFHGKPLTPVTM